MRLPLDLMSSRAFLMAGALSVFAIPSPVFGQAPLVPCGDPRGCPDLVVDGRSMSRSIRFETKTFSTASCSLVEGSVGGAGARRLLRFTFTTPNRGQGDLIIGNPYDHLEWFETSTCHGHLHFKEYADYRLWSEAGYQAWIALRAANPGSLAKDLLAANPDVASQMIEGRKQGFCVIDIVRDAPRSGPAKYTSCSSNQGISVGWADQYVWRLDGQWIDVTGLPAGSYVLEAEVNAERFYQESDYDNNASAVAVQISP